MSDQLEPAELRAIVSAFYEEEILGNSGFSAFFLMNEYQITHSSMATGLIAQLADKGIFKEAKSGADPKNIRLTKKGKMIADSLLAQGFRAKRLVDRDFDQNKFQSNGTIELVPTKEQLDNYKQKQSDLFDKLVDSADWTGFRAPRIDHRNAETFVKLINEAIEEVEKTELSNQCASQALTLLNAAKSLAEAPSPPSDVIWDLVQKAAAIAGLVSTFIAIFSRLLG